IKREGHSSSMRGSPRRGEVVRVVGRGCLSSNCLRPAHHLSLLIEGRAYARLGSGEREELQAGDIVVFPHGDEHFLGNGSPAEPVDSFRTWAKSLDRGLKFARYGGGGERTRFVCGYMDCEPRLSQLFLAGLARLMKVSTANDSSGRWIE